MKKTSGTLAGGSKIVRHSADGGVVRGGKEFAGAGKGGTQHRGTQSGDPPAPHWRRLNNADPGAKK